MKKIIFIFALVLALQPAAKPQVFSNPTPTFVQAVMGTASTGSGVCTVTLTGVVAGHLIVVDTNMGLNSGTLTSLVVSDGASHVYTNSPSTPVQVGPGSGTPSIGFQGIAYFLASQSGTVVITATWTGGVYNSSQADAYEFSYKGTLAFDKDASANSGVHTTSPSSPITTPTLTPTSTGDLLFGFWGTWNGNESGANKPWVTPAGMLWDAYILNSVAGATAASFTDDTTPDYWASQIIGFHSH